MIMDLNRIMIQIQQLACLQAFGKKLPLIMWTSTLTEYSHVENFLDKDDYIIQVGSFTKYIIILIIFNISR